MKIINRSRKKVLAEKAELADSLWKKTKGLMFRAQPTPLMMPFGRDGKHSIWMPFMRFPIDIIFIDSNKRVVDVKENCRPLRFLNPFTWKLFWPKKSARYVLETKAGLVESTGTEPGDVLEF